MTGMVAIQEKLDSYHCSTAHEEDQALREILQEFILAALGRTDYFTKAAFHGGTHLRIFHGLRRFSEDLDFALREADPDFTLVPYLDKVRKELDAIGVSVEVIDKSRVDATVKKAFLKSDSIVKQVDLHFRGNVGSLQTPRKLRIKIEVDSHPPSGARYESGALAFPFPATVTNFDLSSSFAGKMHALLCREYVKGRDWYDLLWYLGARVRLNHDLLSAALDQQGKWAGTHLVTTDSWVRDELKRVIVALDWQKARADVEAFVHASDLKTLDAFSADFFGALVERI